MSKQRRGSQVLLQQAVQYCPDAVLSALRASGSLTSHESIEWLSPLKKDGYKEFKDVEFIEKLGLADRLSTPLAEFWPSSGPRWDGLGITSEGTVVLVEAKAHIPEAASPGSGAKAISSVQLIHDSLEKTRRFIAPRSTASWTDTFYQYTNRIAHQFFLKHLNDVESVLVFLNFINATEMNGPATIEEWIGAKRLMHHLLQLPEDLKSFGVFHAFLDAKLVPSAA